MTDRELLTRIAETHPWNDVNTFNVCGFCDSTWQHRADCVWLEVVRHLGREDLLQGERVDFPGDFYGHGTWATLDGMMDPALCTCPKDRRYGHREDCPIHLPWTNRPWSWAQVQAVIDTPTAASP